MVGLPARGKTYISQKIKHYFEFFHSAPTAVFNAGQTRRKMLGAKSMHTFFDPKNLKTSKLREDIAKKTMENLISWLREDNESDSPLGRIAIYDATNTTRRRRKWIIESLTPVLQSRRHLIFIESVCENKDIVESNILSVKVSMPDYFGLDPKDAMQDFIKRIEHYKKSYEPLDSKFDDQLSWIKTFDGGESLTMNRIKGSLPGKLVTLLMNLHTFPRPIYLSRHGQSVYNAQNRIGGDSGLSEEGEEYAKVLAEYVENEILNHNGSVARNARHSRLYISTMQRSIQTTKWIRHTVQTDGWVTMRPRRFAALDEVYAGKFDGMSPEEILQQAPEESKLRQEDKLNYRYPRGESYSDAIERVQLVALQLERHRDPVLVVAHNGIIRILYAYFKGLSREDAPYVEIPSNCVIKLVPRCYTCEEEHEYLVKSNGGEKEGGEEGGEKDGAEGREAKSRVRSSTMETPI